MKNTNVDKLKIEYEKRQEAAQYEKRFYNEAFINACQKEDTRIILQLIKDLSLWDKAGENVNPDVLAYQRGRRDLWVIIRNYIPKDVLADIEVSDKYRFNLEKE